MEGDVLNLILSVLGGVLGGSGLMGLYIHKQKRKVVFNETLFLEYKSVAGELVDILHDLLTLSFIPTEYTREQLENIARRLLDFYYKNYLILPQSVLLEIQCMYSCLYHNGRRIFKPQKGIWNRIIVQKNLTSLKDQIRFIKDTALMLRYDVESIKRLYRKYPERKRDTFLKCQARRVLTVLDREWDLKKMSNWSEHRRKSTLSMQEIFNLTK